MDREFGFEFPDATLRSREFGRARTVVTPASRPASILRLSAPGVDRLLAHFELYRDLGNLSAAFNQIYDSSPKLGGSLVPPLYRNKNRNSFLGNCESLTATLPATGARASPSAATHSGQSARCSGRGRPCSTVLLKESLEI